MVFYKEKTLDKMSDKEWEDLCDRCGRCCLIKLEDEDTGEFIYSDVRCVLLCGKSGQCKDYEGRKSLVPDCLKLSKENIKEIEWLPSTCAYVKIAKGEDLAWWHPLVAGNDSAIKDAGVSISARETVCSSDMDVDKFLSHIVKWPNLDPKDE